MKRIKVLLGQQQLGRVADLLCPRGLAVLVVENQETVLDLGGQRHRPKITVVGVKAVRQFVVDPVAEVLDAVRLDELGRALALQPAGAEPAAHRLAAGKNGNKKPSFNSTK